VITGAPRAAISFGIAHSASVSDAASTPWTAIATTTPSATAASTRATTRCQNRNCAVPRPAAIFHNDRGGHLLILSFHNP
jgi:hypothetical protein